MRLPDGERFEQAVWRDCLLAAAACPPARTRTLYRDEELADAVEKLAAIYYSRWVERNRISGLPAGQKPEPEFHYADDR
jgi:hypothetical protein